MKENKLVRAELGFPSKITMEDTTATVFRWWAKKPDGDFILTWVAIQADGSALIEARNCTPDGYFRSETYLAIRPQSLSQIVVAHR